MPRQFACVVGARPNFAKMDAVLRGLKMYPEIQPVLVHTGQHYSEQLSGVMLKDLGMKQPGVNLNVGPGDFGQQTGRIIEQFSKFLKQHQPFERVVVVGDVTSTVAATLAAANIGLPVAHVESGLRSFDRQMPEEVNRIVTDSLSDMLFATESKAVENLLWEGHPEDKIHLVGSTMIDGMLRLLPTVDLRHNGYSPNVPYGVVTIHRPSNVDSQKSLTAIIDMIEAASKHIQLLFPIHPRTFDNAKRFGLLDCLTGIVGLKLLPALGYLDFLGLLCQATVVITDSGGIQEETTVLDVPCLTTRKNTERPITVTQGTSTLVDSSTTKLCNELESILNGTYKKGDCPKLWDGHSGERIAKILAQS